MGSGLPPREVSKVGMLEAAGRAIHAADTNERIAFPSDLSESRRRSLLSEAANLRVLAADLENDARRWRKEALFPPSPPPQEKHGDDSFTLSLPVVLLIVIVLLFMLTSLNIYLDGWY